MNAKFKVGMWVFFPASAGQRAYQLQENLGSSYYPLGLRCDGIKYDSFTSDGRLASSDTLSSLFEATPENAELLGRLYGKVFELPPVKPSRKQVIESYLKRDGYVWCGVSDGYAPHARRVGKKYLTKIIKVTDEGYFTGETHWKFAVPFDPKTCREIIELSHD